jgi:glycerophosphoryl diester phosphodiesterase
VNRACLVIAHRGASAYAPENTPAAFDLALEQGARDLELDVHLTADAHLVIIHDDTVDRTSDGHGPVAAHTLAALRALDAGAWFDARFAGQRIPVLAEVLNRYKGRAHLHVELKARSPALARCTAEIVREHGMTGEVTITSFQRERLEEMRACAPELPMGWLVRDVDDDTLARARALGVRQLCPRAALVTPALVARLHAEGFGVRAWGVSDEALMRRVADAGADGMTVNFPDRLLAYLRMRAG